MGVNYASTTFNFVPDGSAVGGLAYILQQNGTLLVHGQFSRQRPEVRTFE